MLRPGNILRCLCAMLLCVGIAEATFINCEIKNPAKARATGFQVMFMSPGTMQKAKLEGVPKQLAGVRLVSSGINEFRWDFASGVGSGQRINVRLEFTPERYWENIFDNRFSYKSGAQMRGVVPYAGFFIYFTPTSDPNKVLATLTVRKNAQGIDDPKVPISFKDSTVYVDNDLKNYKLDKFDRPTGRKLDLPDSFTLGPGEERNFNLGVVSARSYVFTHSTVSYEGSDENYALECAHSYVEQLEKKSLAQIGDK
jgi:hypothetical protein